MKREILKSQPTYTWIELVAQFGDVRAHNRGGEMG